MSIVRDSIRDKLLSAIALSKKYNTKIKSAKTKIKLNYYKNKLVKNNNLIANMIIMLDKIEKGRYNQVK